MLIEILTTQQFDEFLLGLNADSQQAVLTKVLKLKQLGHQLGRPDVDQVNGSKFTNMKEIRVKKGTLAYRAFFAIDPQRRAIILLGGCKTGDKRFYQREVPKADKLYQEHLDSIKEDAGE